MPLVAVIPKPNAAVELREVNSPELEMNSALLEVELSEVCGTDVYLQQGRLEGVPYPLVPGHVTVGLLQKIRGELLDIEGRAFKYTDHGPLPDSAAFNPHLDLNKKHLDVRGCWGSDFSHFYRGAQMISEPERSKSWDQMQLVTYELSSANEALADVASGRVLKALIAPEKQRRQGQTAGGGPE